MAEIAVIGLGIIGSCWAGHYAADGHRVRAWNRTAKRVYEEGLAAGLGDLDFIALQRLVREVQP